MCRCTFCSIMDNHSERLSTVPPSIIKRWLVKALSTLGDAPSSTIVLCCCANDIDNLGIAPPSCYIYFRIDYCYRCIFCHRCSSTVWEGLLPSFLCALTGWEVTEKLPRSHYSPTDPPLQHRTRRWVGDTTLIKITMLRLW